MTEIPARLSEALAERYLAEIRVTANLQHPHILPLHDSGEAGGFLYHVMPYLEGESLRERVDREKQLPVDEAAGRETATSGSWRGRTAPAPSKRSTSGPPSISRWPLGRTGSA